METKATIERRTLQRSLRVAPTAHEPKIKVVAPENPNYKISSRCLVDQPRKTEEILEVRVGGSWKDRWNGLRKN